MAGRVLHGDCRDLLDGVSVCHAEPYHHIEYLEVPEGGFSAVVTDPPYGIEFMSHVNDWDHEVPGPEYWKRILQVCRPGAHLLAFGGTRSFHRLYCAIEDAGWEIRDTIGHLSPLLWTHGVGFPKGKRVDVAIDKHLGATGHLGKAVRVVAKVSGEQTNLEKPQSATQYKPKTEEAKRWSGWDVAIKPSFEPIVLARRPLDGTVAENVLKYGCGALNIDATRIGTEKVTINRFDDGAKPFGGGAGHPYTSNQSTGRWPANLTFSHHPNCVQRGTKKIKGDGRGELCGKRAGGFGDVGAGKGDVTPNAPVYGDEAVEEWDCAQDEIGNYICPVALLDEQSGKSLSSGGLTLGAAPNNIYGNYGKKLSSSAGGLGDFGGASRFFYCSKASTTEREHGLHGRDETEEDSQERVNQHSTVKPLDLLRWLVRLVTPPNGTILDPFGGSGTTGVAARMEGADAVIIDKDHRWVEVARKRMAQAAIDVGEATVEEAEEVGGDVQLGLFAKK